MITTILIVLVAVVVLIVIIAVLALRFLRADDSDTFDDIPDEPRRARGRSPEPGRGQLASGSARRPRPAEPVTEVWSGDRPARSLQARGQGGYRDRDTGPRPAAAERAGSQPGARREPAAARTARAARPADPDALTGSWDSLSDVDYWAELAADKPQITPAAASPAAARSRSSEPGPDARQVPAARPDSRADQGQSPARKRQLPARATGAAPTRPAEPGQTEQIDVRAAAAASARYGGEAGPDGLSADPLRRRDGSRPLTPQRASAGIQAPRSAATRPATGTRPVQPTRPPAPAAQTPAVNGTSRTAGPADDDPLTSPSFPAVNTSDSRSYRGRRSAAGQTSGQHARPGRQYIEYSSAPDRAASRPDGYPVQPAPAQPAAAQPAQPAQPTQPAAAQPAQPAAAQPTQPAAAQPELPAQQSRQSLPAPPVTPAANPYGSYVSAPRPAYTGSAYSEPGYQPGGGYQPAGYPETPAASLAAASYSGYAAGQPAAAGPDWYPAPAIEAGNGSTGAQPLGQPADGYLPAVGLRGTGHGGGSSHIQNGSASRGYTGIDYSNLTYDDPGYPNGQGALASYSLHGQPAAPYDQQGYASQDTGYAQDGYQGYPGYRAGGR